MILTVAKNRLLNLRRDRAGFVLAFVLPVAFFSIFAGVFPSGSRSGTTRKIRVAVVDEDGSVNSKRFVEALEAEPALAVARKPAKEAGLGGAPYTAAIAESAVRSGNVPIALIIPKGFGSQRIVFGQSASRPRVRVFSDSADPIAPQVVSGLIQKTVMTSMPEVMARSGMETFDQWGGGLTPEQRARMEENLGRLREIRPRAAQPAEKESGGLIEVEIRDVVGEEKKNPVIAFYAAGLGVMFLLFTAAGSGGALIEEAESGTLDRVLATRVSMTQLLSGKLLYLAALALTQLTLMFVWGAVFFGLELQNHLPGFFTMAVVSALAASTFGLMLAAICRTRMQLVALSNISILLMSALGGSMFPRFLMPEKMQKIGLITINAWSLDGFQKVFWREEPLRNLWPQVAVLLAASLLFFAVARRIARRWEVA